MSSINNLSIQKRESNAWSELNGNSIFITGGTGFFGSALLYSLLLSKEHKHNLDIQITILTRNIKSFKIIHPILANANFISLIEGDITDFEFPKNKFSKIFHLATTSAAETFNGEDQLSKYKTLVEGTERVLQFAAHCNAEKVIFTSSGVVYGNLNKDMATVDEIYTGSPDTTLISSALAQGKRGAEFLISYYADKYDFEFVIARCFSFVGPSLPLNLHYAIGNFVYDALYKDSVEIKGDGKAVRSYLDVSDLIVWLLRLMTRNCNHKIYNVGSDESISIAKLAELVIDIVSPKKKLIIHGDSRHSIGNYNRIYYVPNIDRIKFEHKVDVWIGLDKAIKRLKFNANNFDLNR